MYLQIVSLQGASRYAGTDVKWIKRLDQGISNITLVSFCETAGIQADKLLNMAKSLILP
jgi:hypothetical protein